MTLAAHGCACGDGAPAPSTDVPSERVAAPEVSEARVFFIGHSLINFVMPAMMQSVAASRGVRMEWTAHIKDGAGLKVNWEQHDEAMGVSARTELPSGRYDVVVMTEAVSLDDMIRWMEPARHGGYFYDLAVASRPDVRIFMFETWHGRDEARTTLGCARGGDFRTYLDEDLPKWEGIVDGIEEGREGPVMNIVPGGQALARLIDEIRAGRVPGIDQEARLYSDAIHMGPLGNYFMALVQFAAVFRQTPVGATTTVRDPEGQLLVEVAPETALALQRIAWEAVRAYPRSGVMVEAAEPPSGAQ